MNYWLIFLTGLTTGGLTCLALQGGLLASTMVETEHKVARVKAIALFLAAKLVAYTLLGLVLGWMGEFFALSPKVLGILNILIALYMLAIAFEALKLHPFFKYFLIQPPKFLRRLVFRHADTQGDFAATVLGIFTVLIPCGVTQAMMALAVSSGSPLKGALTLFFFILGTIPVFFTLAYLAAQISDGRQKIFHKVVAVLLIVLSIYTFSNGVKLSGWHFKLPQAQTQPEEIYQATSEGEIQRATIKLDDRRGYIPNKIKLKKGIPAEITIDASGAGGCIRVFVIPDIGLRQVVRQNSGVVKFTPQTSGTLSFTCSMGMYYGEFIVE